VSTPTMTPPRAYQTVNTWSPCSTTGRRPAER
jgi:hypothetical protein